MTVARPGRVERSREVVLTLPTRDAALTADMTVAELASAGTVTVTNSQALAPHSGRSSR